MIRPFYIRQDTEYLNGKAGIRLSKRPDIWVNMQMFFLTEVNSFLLLEYVFVQWISMEKQI